MKTEVDESGPVENHQTTRSAGQVADASGRDTDARDRELLRLWSDLLGPADLVSTDLSRRLAPAGRTPDDVELLVGLAAAPE